MYYVLIAFLAVVVVAVTWIVLEAKAHLPNGGGAKRKAGPKAGQGIASST
jgi:hypothetical protein